MIAAPLNEQRSSTGEAIGRALVPFVPAPAAKRSAALRWTALAAAFGLATGFGGAAAYGLRHHMPWSGAGQPTASAAMVQHLQEQVGRLQGSLDQMRTSGESIRAEDQLRGLKRSVEALKQDVEQVRSSGTATVAQLSAKIDKTDHDPSPKLAEIVARLERIEHDGGTRSGDVQGQKLGELAGRMDRLERQVASPATTGSIPLPATRPVLAAPNTPAATASAVYGPAAALPAAKPGTPAAPAKAVATLAAGTAARAAQLPLPPARAAEVTQVPGTPARVQPATSPAVTGWVLRDVYDGMALVEARDGGLREIEPGEYLPGAGQIRSIERHGRGWVVMTSRGVISNETF